MARAIDARARGAGPLGGRPLRLSPPHREPRSSAAALRILAIGLVSLALVAAAAARADEDGDGPVGAADGGAADEIENEDVWAATVAGEVVPRGRIQVELGAIYEDRGPGQNFFLETPIVLRFGLLEGLEAHVTWPPYLVFEDDDHGREEGIGDAVFGLRYLFREQDGYIPALVVGGFAKAPFASEHEGLGSGEADIAVRLDATTYWVEDVFYTDLSLQSTWLGQGRGAGPFFYQQTTVEFLAGYDGLEPATLYSQITWETEDAPGRDVHDSIFLAFGAFWFPRQWLAFDFGVDIGLGEDDAEWGLFFTVIWMSDELW